jgi:hypothetical protein
MSAPAPKLIEDGLAHVALERADEGGWHVRVNHGDKIVKCVTDEIDLCLWLAGRLGVSLAVPGAPEAQGEQSPKVDPSENRWLKLKRVK